MTKDNFFEQQTDLTAIKIKFYQEYIGNYLIKNLMQFGMCFVADLFCGAGKNGEQNGSPLILLGEAQKMLSSPVLKNKWPNSKLFILFNDVDSKNIENLQSELKKVNIPNNIKVTVQNKSFSEILTEHNKILTDAKIPKFFFLDPFGYSNIQINEIKQIIAFPYSEILLFIPSFDAYRFAEGNNRLPEKTKRFLEDFTSKGVHNYDNIDDFNDSIREKLMTSTGLDFVRPILLDGGKRKHALFFLTKHVVGMMLTNKIIWKSSDDGQRLKVNKTKTMSLFAPKEIRTADCKDKICLFQKKLLEKLKMQAMNNTEIIKFTAIEGFLSEHSEDILCSLKKDGKIKVAYLSKEKTRGFYIGDNNWNNKLSIIELIPER